MKAESWKTTKLKAIVACNCRRTIGVRPLHFSFPDLQLSAFASIVICGFILTVALCASPALAQDRIEKLPGYERYKLISDSLDKLAVGGRISRVVWSEDSKTLTFRRQEKDYTFNLATRELTEVEENDDDGDDASTRPASRPYERAGVGRGQQRGKEISPDGVWNAIARDWNVVLEKADGSETIAVTSTGTRKLRYGKASWVYGEELDQTEAMWWSPDSKRLVFYEFDERLVPDFPLLKGLSDLRPEVVVEGYPKPGEPNPIASLLIYDLETKRLTRVHTGGDLDQYVYNVRFAPPAEGDSAELLFSRTNRLQNVLEVLAANPVTGESRVVVREEQATWQNNRPEMRFLDDGRRFIWETEKSGFKQYELRDLAGSFIGELTRGDRPVNGIEHVDEEAGALFYTAFTDANPLNVQLHRVNLDGSSNMQLTSNGFTHSVNVSPDGRWFITRFETIHTPPATALYDTWGRRVMTLAESDDSKVKELGLEQPELFSFMADDGRTMLYGQLHKPSDFDPKKKYPLVVDVYGGPFTQAVRNRYVPAKAECEFGWLIAEIDNRGTINRGKAFETATYLGLGGVDLKDQADGVKFLASRDYIDASRVGIHGHSYGGFMSGLAIVKHPDVFQVAVAASAVTDWRNYDTIYTERYMQTPQQNEEGYDAGSCIEFANQLTGNLLILHGMMDDNVHPTNAWQFAEALNKAQKEYDMLFLANASHSLGGAARTARLEFLSRHLVQLSRSASKSDDKSLSSTGSAEPEHSEHEP